MDSDVSEKKKMKQSSCSQRARQQGSENKTKPKKLHEIIRREQHGARRIDSSRSVGIRKKKKKRGTKAVRPHGYDLGEAITPGRTTLGQEQKKAEEVSSKKNFISNGGGGEKWGKTVWGETGILGRLNR